MLLAASVAALLVYTVRRHRTDDYQGRYRVWLWAAGCWFLMATDQAASLREGFRDVMIALTGTPLLGDGSLWWVVVYVLVFGAVVRGCCWTCGRAGFRSSPWSAPRSPTAWRWPLSRLETVGTAAGEVMFRAGSEMAGHLMLLAAMGLHARYVILDAQGLMPHPEPQEG